MPFKDDYSIFYWKHGTPKSQVKPVAAERVFLSGSYCMTLNVNTLSMWAYFPRNILYLNSLYFTDSDFMLNSCLLTYF